MIVTFVGGTTQQQDWVNEALTLCLYPADNLGLPFPPVVTWADPTPCGAAHTYMCTTNEGDGHFTVTIESWADDPANANNSGVPTGKLQSFYMESFVHEIGHITQYTVLSSDALRTAACELFTHTDGRTGTLADYAPLDKPWADRVVEAISECFKCAFYEDPLTFGNRTNWSISQANWLALMNLLELPSRPGPAFRSDFSLAVAPVVVEHVNFFAGGALAGFHYGPSSEQLGADLLTLPGDPIFGQNSAFWRLTDWTTVPGSLAEGGGEIDYFIPPLLHPGLRGADDYVPISTLIPLTKYSGPNGHAVVRVDNLPYGFADGPGGLAPTLMLVAGVQPGDSTTPGTAPDWGGFTGSSVTSGIETAFALLTRNPITHDWKLYLATNLVSAGSYLWQRQEWQGAASEPLYLHLLLGNGVVTAWLAADEAGEEPVSTQMTGFANVGQFDLEVPRLYMFGGDLENGLYGTATFGFGAEFLIAEDGASANAWTGGVPGGQDPDFKIGLFSWETTYYLQQIIPPYPFGRAPTTPSTVKTGAADTAALPLRH